jgi:hypothetical protein
MPGETKGLSKIDSFLTQASRDSNCKSIHCQGDGECERVQEGHTSMSFFDPGYLATCNHIDASSGKIRDHWCSKL